MLVLLAVSIPELAIRYRQPASSLFPVLPAQPRLGTGGMLAVLLCTDAAPDHWENGVHQVLVNVHSQSDARKRSPSAYRDEQFVQDVVTYFNLPKL